MDFLAHRIELDQIALTATAHSESAVVFVGEHGIGKSQLLRLAVAESTVQAVLLRVNPAESEWPLSGFSSVFASIGDSRAVEFGGRFTLRSTEPQFMFAAARDLLSVLRGLNLDPLLVLIDDIDLMDTESIVLLGFMAGRLAGTGIRIVSTATRVTDDSPLAGFAQHEIHHLTDRESVDLAMAYQGPAADDGTMRILASLAGGNPLVMLESMQTLDSDQVQGKNALVLPLRPSAVVQLLAAERLAGISEPDRRMLEKISLAPFGNIAALTHEAADDEDALEDMLYAGLVIAQGQHVRFAEPLVRAYVYWEMKPRDRRELHKALAEANAGVDERLHVWHGSFLPSADDDFGVGLLEAAMALAADNDAGAALELAERALVTSKDVGALNESLLRLSSVFSQRGALELATRYLQHVRFSPAATSLHMKLAIARIVTEFERTQIVPTSDIEAAVTLYADADPAGAVRLLAMATKFHAGRWEVAEATDALTQAEHYLEGAGPDERIAYDEARAMLEAVDNRPEHDTGAQNDIVIESLGEASITSLIALASVLSYRERYAEARRVQAVMAGHSANEPIAMEWARTLACVSELRAGDFHRARTAIEDWMSATLRPTSRRSVRPLLLGWYAFSKGRIEESRVLWAECFEAASLERNQAVLARLFGLQGQVALLNRDDEEAARLLQLADATATHIENLSLVRHAADLVEALALVGRTREATAVMQRMSDQLVLRPTRWLMLTTSRAIALLAPDDTAVERFRDAVGLFRPGDSDYELGRTLSAQAACLARLGQTRESELALVAATAAYVNAGANVWAARSAAKPDAAPSPVAAGAVFALLTPDERVVAELVSKGYRNREIAAELYISLRTVELRLTHIYRKVGARSRSHLASLLN
jgi:DNA-binding CsgD family transcriptional regulator